ncbi:MAG: hypothetical protein ACYC24_00765 [Desulfobacteria bacterium]
MRKKGLMILALATGMLLAGGSPFLAVTAVQADLGCGHLPECGQGCSHRGECQGCPGCGCDSGCPKGARQGVPPCMQDNAAAVPGGMHRMMHGGGAPPMWKARENHLEEMRGTILKLRALEAKMDAVKSKDDAAFRAASLEHSRLLTDLQASHLKQMERMMGGK